MSDDEGEKSFLIYH